MQNSDVFEIRKKAKDLNGLPRINKLLEGLQGANKIVGSGNADDWTQKAIAWILIDLIKEYLNLGNQNSAQKYFEQLSRITFEEEDDIISSQIKYLRSRVDVDFEIISKAQELSKTGKHKESLSIFKKQIEQNRLKPLHHEDYGWAIYRYLRSNLNTLDSVTVRTYLRDYMNLKNERPSMLHSMILNFGLNYSKDHADFNLLKFFELWGTENLRHDDKVSSEYEGNKIPSLIARVCRELVDKNYKFDVLEFVQKIEVSSYRSHWNTSNKEAEIDLLREPYFWALYELHKEKRWGDLWDKFENYSKSFCCNIKSKWHSEILNLANRCMIEIDASRFYSFFKNWNPELLRPEDWEKEVKDEQTYDSLSVKALKKAADVALELDDEHQWLIDVFYTAIKKDPENIWLKRRLALLQHKVGNNEKAIEIYQELAEDLFKQSYYWKEFSSLIIENEELQFSMLCKAVLTEKNEDYLGEVRLSLARAFLQKGKLDEAGIELFIYKENRTKNGWRLASEYGNLEQKANVSEGSNLKAYKEASSLAETYAFKNSPWKSFIFIDEFIDKKKKQQLVFVSADNKELIASGSFLKGESIKIGDQVEFKLKESVRIEESTSRDIWTSLRSTREREIKTYKPILFRVTGKRWKGIFQQNAVIDYVNDDKNVIHAITFSNEEVVFKSNNKLKGIAEGDFVRGRMIKRRSKKVSDFLDIELINDSSIIDEIDQKIAVVDGVNEEKELFHFVVDKSIQGIIKFVETDLRPELGEFLKVRLLTKQDRKKNQLRCKVLSIEKTEESSNVLLKTVVGKLDLKYKRGNRPEDYFDFDYNPDDDFYYKTDQHEWPKPDFAFVDDYYVPKYILEKHNIKYSREVEIKILLVGKGKPQAITMDVIDKSKRALQRKSRRVRKVLDDTSISGPIVVGKIDIESIVSKIEESRNKMMESGTQNLSDEEKCEKYFNDSFKLLYGDKEEDNLNYFDQFTGEIISPEELMSHLLFYKIESGVYYHGQRYSLLLDAEGLIYDEDKPRWSAVAEDRNELFVKWGHLIMAIAHYHAIDISTLSKAMQLCDIATYDEISNFDIKKYEDELYSMVPYELVSRLEDENKGRTPNSINDALKYTDQLIIRFPEFNFAYTLKAIILFEKLKFNHLILKETSLEVEDPLIYHNLSIDNDPNSAIHYFARGEYYLESLTNGINSDQSNIILALIDFKLSLKNQSNPLLLDQCIEKLINCLDFIIDEHIFDLNDLIKDSDDTKNRFLQAWNLNNVSEFNVTGELNELEKKNPKPWR